MRTIICTLIVILVSFSSVAQNASETGPVAAPANISKELLASHGFSFDPQKRSMCAITGPEGTCHVEAFVFGETKTGEGAFTCSKLDRASYVGHCKKGKLDGVSLVIADGSSKLVKEAFLSYFEKGQMAYPAVTSSLAADLNFGVREWNKSYGCVYFGKWDRSAERCGLFIRIYGDAFFTDSNAQKLRDGTFDLPYYRAKFLDYLNR